MQQRLDLQQGGDALDRLVLARLRHAPALHAEGDVLARRHGRIERIGLEHHGDVAILGRHRVDEPPVYAYLAFAHALQPRDHREQGRFAAARGADESDELARARVKIDALQHLDGAEALAQPRDVQGRHIRTLI